MTASDGSASDWFGSSVSLSDDTLVVGARFDDGSAGFDQGAAYVFRRVAGAWTEQIKLLATDPGLGDFFGTSVATDGETVLVGSPSDDGPAGGNQGSVHIFVRAGGDWSHQAKLTPTDSASGDFFGQALAVSGDTIVVGAHGDDGTTGLNQGAVYVFVRDKDTWTQQAKLTPGDAAVADTFGASLALEGNTLLVGAHLKSVTGGVLQGAAYVFVRNGLVWNQQAKLIALDGMTDDQFGLSVALSGNTAVIGARNDDGPAGDNQGSVYVFTRTDTSWTQQAKLVPADSAALDYFGFAVSIEGDRVVAGADKAGYGSGAVYVFTRSDSIWTQGMKLVPPDSSVTPFGSALDLSADILVVGVYGEDGVAGVNQGAVHVYDWDCCMADLTDDRVVDFIDYLAFLNFFEVSSPFADFTGDGVIDFGDYLEFLNRYDSGC